MTEQVYDARAVKLTNIGGKVTVGTGRGSGIAVRVTGPAKLVKSVTCEVEGATLHVSGPDGGGMTISDGMFVSGVTTVFGNCNVVSGGRFGSMQIGDGGIHISNARGPVYLNGRLVTPDDGSGEGETGEVVVAIELPRRTPVTIAESGGGSYHIGDTEGPLGVRSGGYARVVAGRVGEAHVHTSGSGDVWIGTVTGAALKVKVTGSSEVTVREGLVDRLEVKVTGSGSLMYGGTTARAELKQTGSGEIRVNEVTEQLEERNTGSGRIVVFVQPRRNRDDFWK